MQTLIIKNIALAISILFFSSCKKYGFGYIEGTVYDCRTSLPIKNANIQVTRAFHGNQEEIYATAITDANGHFKIKYEKGLSYIYELGISSKKYDYSAGKRLELRQENTNFFLGYKTNIKFTVKNKRLEKANVFFAGINPVLFKGIDVRANCDTVISGFSINGCNTTLYNWNYITPTYTSEMHPENVNIPGTTDTIYKTLEIN